MTPVTNINHGASTTLGNYMALRLIGQIARLAVLALVLASCAQPEFAQSFSEFHRTFPVSLAEPVSLQVELSEGELTIAYSRDGEVSIAAIAQISAGAKTEGEFPAATLAIQQDGNHIHVQRASQAGPLESGPRVTYRIDVPYRTEVDSFLAHGKQTITGIMGPIQVETKNGDIKLSYISKNVLPRAGSGDLDFQVIGEHIEAKTGRGNISCVRAPQGVSAETQDGDIALMVVGPSNATVRRETGRIDAGGLRGSFLASTDPGDLHVKAIPHYEWRLNSASGNIRVELPSAAKFEIDAAANSGEVIIGRDGIHRADAEVRRVHQEVNGGGKRVAVQTDSGRIVIT